jgi:hypothetical protein
MEISACEIVKVDSVFEKIIMLYAGRDGKNI